MNEYIVRLWVDIHIFAETKDDAVKKAENWREIKVDVSGAEVYDTQVSGEAWERSKE
jgi:hypothetical protein